jgi:hypothetical protein
MSERLSRGEQLAGIAGLALILIMFLFAWYGVDEVPGFDAFDAYDDWVNIILVFTSFAAMSLALFGAGVARVQIPLSVIVTVLGAVSALIILIYIISPPGIGSDLVEIDLGRKVGVWLGLISSVAIALGGYLAMQEEGTSFQQTADRLGGPGDRGTAPPSPTPAAPQPPTQPPPPPST